MKKLIHTLILGLAIASGQESNAQRVPLLNSYSQASAVMFLDFDGHNVTGSAWNSNGDIPCGPSGLDSAQITEVFHRVAEDYRPFNLNVTTDSTKYLAAPADTRMRVIVTISSSWYGSAGGVACVGSFTWGDDTPCFVFSALHKYRVKYIAEALSHEAGHTLGLYHQSEYDATCKKTTDYSVGKGNGEIGWAPIMGVGYYQNFTTWHNGPNSFGCSSTQSDLEIITDGWNGFGFRNDDHGNNFDSATQPVFANQQLRMEGVIEQNVDQDYFKFIMPTTGVFQLDAIPNNVGVNNAGSDLDLQVTLFNSSKTALSVYNPGALLSSVVDTALNAGTYYLKVEGRGNQFASNYASLGSYSLQGRTIDGGGSILAVRQIELKGTQTGDARQFSWVVDADEDILEQSLEVSLNGRTFQSLTSEAAANRSYAYRPGFSGSAMYRLNVTFSNGRRSYSNVVTLSEAAAGARPVINGTLVRSNTIQVQSPGTFHYTVFDMNGRALKAGLLQNGINDISASSLGAGLYVIQFNGNDQKWSDRFVRQ